MNIKNLNETNYMNKKKYENQKKYNYQYNKYIYQIEHLFFSKITDIELKMKQLKILKNLNIFNKNKKKYIPLLVKNCHMNKYQIITK